MADIEELKRLAAQLARPGRGILAADESVGTLGKRLVAQGLSNDAETRRAFREILLTAKGNEESLSGVILFHETLYQKADGGRSFVRVLTEKGILVGVKVDTGLRQLEGSPRETHTSGLEGLAERCAEYKRVGATFVKWRAALRVDELEGLPSAAAVATNATELAAYARTAVDAGLVPIVEPEVLVDGTHTAAAAAHATRVIIAACYKELRQIHVPLGATLLKPMMIAPGISCAGRAASAAPDTVAHMTLDVMRDVVPPEVPGIMFLSGGMGEAEATRCLHALNRAALDQGGVPWSLSFSFGRALQTSPLNIWNGQKERRDRAMRCAAALAKANADAQLAKFQEPHPSLTEGQSLYESFRGWRGEEDTKGE